MLEKFYYKIKYVIRTFSPQKDFLMSAMNNKI